MAKDDALLEAVRWEVEKYVGGRRMTDLDVQVQNNLLTDRPNIDLFNTMLLDPGVSFPLHMLKLPISRSRFVYQNQDADIQAFVEGELKELHHTLRFESLTALEHGFSSFERRYEIRDAMTHYKEFIHLNPKYIWIRIDPKTKGFNGLQQRYRGNTIDLRPEKSYVFSHEQYFSNLYGRSQINYAYVPWLLDKEFYRYHGLALQEFGLQTLVGRAPEGNRTINMGEAGDKTISNLEFIKMIGETVRSRTVVTYPAGEGWDLGTLFKSMTGWDFNKDHDFLDNKKALAILLPPELWRGGGGSYAKSRVQSYWFEQTIGAILDELSRAIMRYVVKPIIRLNFWDGREEPPYGTVSCEPPSMEYQQFVEKLILKTNKPQPIDWNALLKIMRIPLKTDVEEVGLEEMPTTAKTLEDFCRRAFTSGVEFAKDELACPDLYIPIPEEKKKQEFRAEAGRLQWLVKKMPSPRKVLVTVYDRIRLQGRDFAHEFFCKTVEDGGYLKENREKINAAIS
jgi:hypothetical protein